MRKPIFVVDTNVPIIANGQSGSPDCQLQCAGELLEITADRARVAIDDGGEILREYMRYLSHSGQPGVGDAFFRWLFDNQAVLERCEKVDIPCRSNDPTDFEHFPDHPRLKGFDPSDKKFVAVARAHPERPSILEAADAKFIGWASALAEEGVAIRFLCEEDLQRIYEEKVRRRRSRRPRRGKK